MTVRSRWAIGFTALVVAFAWTLLVASVADAAAVPCAPDFEPCDDGNPCTQQDVCSGGVCLGGDPKICTALDQCHIPGTCDPAAGACSNPPKPNGSACSDGDMCTQTDTCQAGVCTGTTPVVCSPLDECHVAGTCDPATGTCSNPAKTDGSTCNDGNVCTLGDTCLGGSCSAGTPKTCLALDQCHLAGTCNPSTAACSNPQKPNGSTCNDGNACTQRDSCQDGSCTGTIEPAGTLCRPAAGGCDLDERCNGVSDRCPADALAPAGTVCRVAAGICDLLETCTGATAACPGNAKSTAMCRPAASVCDRAEFCDGVSDDCPTDDPRTAGVPATRTVLKLTKLGPPAGDDGFTFAGEGAFAVPIAPEIDPLARGVRLVVQDARGGTVLDTIVPGGTYVKSNRSGWKVNSNRTKWIYRGRGEPPVDIKAVEIKAPAKLPGMIKYSAKARSGSYTAATSNLPLRGTVVLDSPIPDTGHCIVASFPAIPHMRPSCLIKGKGDTVKCK